MCTFCVADCLGRWCCPLLFLFPALPLPPPSSLLPFLALSFASRTLLPRQAHLAQRRREIPLVVIPPLAEGSSLRLSQRTVIQPWRHTRCERSGLRVPPRLQNLGRGSSYHVLSARKVQPAKEIREKARLPVAEVPQAPVAIPHFLARGNGSAQGEGRRPSWTNRVSERLSACAWGL